MAGGEQFAIEPHDLVVDPGLLTLGAGAHDRFERAVGDHPESIRPHRLGEAARDDEPVEREDSALLRLDPEQVLGVAAFGHRKDADRIGPEQDVRRQLEFSRRGFHGRNRGTVRAASQADKEAARRARRSRRSGAPRWRSPWRGGAVVQSLRITAALAGPERHKIPASVPTAEPRKPERRDVDPPECRGTGAQSAHDRGANDRGMRDGQRRAFPRQRLVKPDACPLDQRRRATRRHAARPRDRRAMRRTLPALVRRHQPPRDRANVHSRSPSAPFRRRL